MQLEKDSMRQKERLECILNHQEADRVPCFLMGLETSGEFWREFLERGEPLLDDFTDEDKNILITPLGDFTVPVFLGTDVLVRGCIIEEPKAQWVSIKGSGSNLEIIPLEKKPDYERENTGFYLTYYGSINKFEQLPNGRLYTWHYSPTFKSPESLVHWFDEKGWPEDLPFKSFQSEIVSTNAQFDRSLHVIPSYGPSILTHLQTMLGFDRILYFARKSPEILKKIIDSMATLHLRQIEQMRTIHPLAIFTYDDHGQKDRPLVSPAFFRKFLAPARKRVNDLIHELGAKSILHSCGNNTQLLPDLIEAGFDGWQTLEPASGIDHAQVKKQFGDKLSFWGAIDNNVLCFGTPTEVESRVSQMLRTMAPGGGYLLGPAHDYLNTKLDNAFALRDALKKYGYYPIQ